MADPNGTLTISADTDAEGAITERVPALVIAWCVQEPERIGEAFLATDGPYVLGRGGPRDGDPHPRLLPVRQLPGRLETRLPLVGQGLSRVQLTVTRRRAALEVACVGKLPLFVNGDRVERAVVESGDVLVLGRQLVLRCTERPALLPQISGFEHRFGAADAYGIVGESPAAWEVRRQIAFTAARRGHVLVSGPSGSGKELVARALHERSARRTGPFVARSAATLPESLAEAELFGHARNYPNPGMPQREGLVGRAQGGTLFLDEIGELPDNLQTRLLRVLDAGEYERLGEGRTRTADFRCVGATNRPLDALRHDLAARLPLRIEVSGLDERLDDVPLLVVHLLRRMATDDPDVAERVFADGDARSSPRLATSLVRTLLRHTFHTHTRELELLLWRAVEHSDGPLELPPDATSSPPVGGGLDYEPVDPNSLTAEQVQEALDACNGVQQKAWRALRLPNRHALARLIRKHGLVVRKRTD